MKNGTGPIVACFVNWTCPVFPNCELDLSRLSELSRFSELPSRDGGYELYCECEATEFAV